MDDVTKKLEALEKRIKELESKQKANQQMFGRSYSQAGDINSDFLIKTRGQIKCQIGNKFIDLIKDGKVNCDAKFIYKGSVGSKDGIYVDGEEVWLKVGDNTINLIGEIGTTYVSFLGEQETSSDQKHTALTNIGLIAETQNDVNITSGIVYIESEGKLYLVKNGFIEEFKIDFPNPFPEQFIIAKNDSKFGSLLIQGNGKENSLAFNGLYIYSDGNSIIDSESLLNINISGTKVATFDNFQTIFYKDVISDMFKSDGATSSSGFRLYKLGGQSTLEIDNLIWRNKPNDLNVIGEYWYSIANVISNIKVTEEENQDEELFNNFTITLNQPNIFKIGDKLVVFKENIVIINEETDDEYTTIELSPIYFEVTDVFNNNIEVISNDPLSENIDLIGKTIYKIDSAIRIKDNNLDIVDENLISKLRIGDIDKEIIDNVNGNQQIKDSGIYSDIGLFKEASYTSDYQLDENDNSSRFASTEWIQKKLNEESSLIILFSGTLVNNGTSFVIDLTRSIHNSNIDKLSINYLEESKTTLKIDILPKSEYTCKVTSVNALVSKAEIHDVFTNTGHWSTNQGYWITGGVKDNAVYLAAWIVGENNDVAANAIFNVDTLNVTIFGIIQKNS